MIPEIFLALLLAISGVTLADAIWRLWRGRPWRFRPWPDSGLYVLIAFVALPLPAWDTRDLIAKTILVIILAALIIVGMLSRNRASAHS